MSHPIPTRLAAALLLAVAGPALAQQAAPAPTTGATFEIRSRFESVDDDAFAQSAEALTVRARLGYRMVFNPTWSALVEAEANGHLGDEQFNSTENGQTGYPSVVDPDNFELNQAVLNFTPAASTRASLGRQRLVYGNQRFIGNVGWRQNEQTFDALDVQHAFGNGLTLRYSYLDRVQRIFGDNHPNQALARWNLDSHVFDASYKLGPGVLSAYVHLFDIETVPASSHRNAGVRYAAQGGPADGTGWQATVEYAKQRPYADGLDRNEADYLWIDGGLRWQGNQFNLGFEQLGGDGRYGFQTPFATLHAFNGWADRFLTTPVNGLNDVYLGWKRGFGAWTANVVVHDFEADQGGADYGQEWDASLGWAFAPKWNAMFKWASYDSDGFGADVDKLWLSLEYKL